MRNSVARFLNRAEDYERYRPTYPFAAIAALVDRCGLDADRKVADIGAGTGIFSRQLAEVVGHVFAVEPNPVMQSKASPSATITWHDGTAEATGLMDTSIDLITAAQAFHWFDRPAAQAEFRRILRPAGWVALIWNERLASATPFLEGYQALLRDYCGEDAVGRHRDVDPLGIEAFMAPHAMEILRFPHHQDLDLPGLQGRSMSSSYAPARDSADAEQFLSALGDLFQATAVDGSVRMAYETRLYLSQWG